VLMAVVCLSVRPFVRSVPRPKLRTERPRKPIFGTMEAHDPGTHEPVSKSKVKVTGPTTADTLNAPYLPNTKAYELQTW